jgi:predicted  nucleic acid-binding Zn-ribbon protein
MLDVIKQLLVLQERDQKIGHLENELNQLGPQRQHLAEKERMATVRLASQKELIKKLEVQRKSAETEVEQKKELIGRYALQQFQTKKNDEYKALAHEIDGCNAQIAKLDDQQLELMEQMELAHKTVAEAQVEFAEAKKVVDSQMSNLAAREAALSKELATLKQGREQIAANVDERERLRYERLYKNKDGRVLAGVAHGICGGCHMKLPPQIALSSQIAQEIVLCPNCGRMLYYSSEMDMTKDD